MISDGLVLQSFRDEVLDKGTHHVEYALAVRQVLRHASPSLRPFMEVRTYVFRGLYLFPGNFLLICLLVPYHDSSR